MTKIIRNNNTKPDRIDERSGRVFAVNSVVSKFCCFRRLREWNSRKWSCRNAVKLFPCPSCCEPSRQNGETGSGNVFVREIFPGERHKIGRGNLIHLEVIEHKPLVPGEILFFEYARKLTARNLRRDLLEKFHRVGIERLNGIFALVRAKQIERGLFEFAALVRVRVFDFDKKMMALDVVLG